MGLALVLGPAKAGKIAHLLDGYLAALERDPVLIVPNRADIDRVERDLLRRVGALLAGSIGTFDDLFRELARDAADARPVAGETQRTLVARRALARTPLAGLDRSARFSGFADALLGVLAELEAGLLDARSFEDTPVDGDLALPVRGLPRGARRRRALGPRSAPPARGRAARLGAGRLGRPPGVRVRVRGPDGRRVGAARSALRAGGGDRLASLRARPSGLRVAAPNAGGSRVARRRRDRGAPARARRVRVPPRSRTSSGISSTTSRPATRPSSTGRSASSRRPAPAARSSSSPKRCGSSRGDGIPLEEIALVVPSVERWRAPVETVLGTLGIPFAVEGRAPARPDAVRPGSAGAAPLRLAAGRSPRPVLAISARPSPGSRARTSTSSKVACAGGP